jgi:hypothetical protein
MRVVVASLVMALGAGAALLAQAPLERLSVDLLDVQPPSARVGGEPGSMTTRQVPCRTLPATEVRQRIVEVAVQEWGFFGFTVADYTETEDDDDGGGNGWRRRRLPPETAIRVASSIAGYWSVTPSGGWIVSNQNRVWAGDDGAAARWRYPWSAAFVSWVMCEGGLGATAQFQRAVAHHAYIDQAIRARADAASRAAYVAHDRGETAVTPGDLLCTSRRPVYRTLAERRRQLGAGARTHCDIVVKVEAASGRIFAIGGNVRGSVSLKVLPPASVQPRRAEDLSPPGARPIFAHLKLRAAPVTIDVFEASPTLAALGCGRPAGLAVLGRQAACALSLD